MRKIRNESFYCFDYFIKKMCREQRIPFDVSVYNSDTLRILDDVKNKRNLSKVFNNTEDLFNDLDDED